MIKNKTDFKEIVEEIDPGLLRFSRLETLQVNLGNRCNLSCRHCHVQASPSGKKIMTKDVMEGVIGFLGSHEGVTADITGGCPELNPDFKFFIEEVCRLCRRVMIRTNLSIFFEPGMEWTAGWYRDHNVAVIGSLPCYTRENVDRQRGTGVFDKSIRAIKMLNEMGYGKDDGLELDLVYNPGGDFLPAPQMQLETDYKVRLFEDHGVVFNKLFTITNAPIGRFRQFLESSGKLQSYMRLLEDNFNRQAVKNIMCRTLLSVDYKGIIYNCDFNQALGLPITDAEGEIVRIERLDSVLSSDMEIVTGDHCFSCTAGDGSSCTGALNSQTD